jgi:hypothetical protein
VPDLSPEAQERARETIAVAEVFGAHAERIVAAIAEVEDTHVLVAVVDRGHEFTGTHYVSKDDLVESVPALEGDGWAMVFSTGADVEHVRRRTDEMASIAQQRIDMIDRIVRRRSQADAGGSD